MLAGRVPARQRQRSVSAALTLCPRPRCSLQNTRRGGSATTVLWTSPGDRCTSLGPKTFISSVQSPNYWKSHVDIFYIWGVNVSKVFEVNIFVTHSQCSFTCKSCDYKLIPSTWHSWNNNNKKNSTKFGLFCFLAKRNKDIFRTVRSECEVSGDRVWSGIVGSGLLQTTHLLPSPCPSRRCEWWRNGTLWTGRRWSGSTGLRLEGAEPWGRSGAGGSRPRPRTSAGGAAGSRPPTRRPNLDSVQSEEAGALEAPEPDRSWTQPLLLPAWHCSNG